MTGSVVLLLGRAPSAGSVVHGVRAALRAAGADVGVHVVGGDLPAAVAGADLLVHKDLPPQHLSAVARLGTPACNDPAAELRSLDKSAVVDALQEAGLPVPASRTTADWGQVQQAAARGPVVVKPQVGTQGAGVLLLDGPAPDAPVVPGPWLVQEHVPGDGLDRKLYVVGERVDALLRRWPDRVRSTPVAPGPELTTLGRAAARALGLELCGVDVLLSPDGPVVVDVNAFPGFKSVPDAAGRIATHLLARLSEEVAVCA